MLLLFPPTNYVQKQQLLSLHVTEQSLFNTEKVMSTF